MKRILDQYGNVLKEFHYDDMTRQVTINVVQDCEPAIEANKAAQKQPQRPAWETWLRRIASIPNVITLKWLQEDGVYWPRLRKHEQRKYLRRKLNDPDYAFLKTTPEKV